MQGSCKKIVRKIKVLAIQNCETEGIGLYEQYLIDRKIKYDVSHAYANRKFSPLEKYDVFIVGGTPISACEIHKHNFLKKEWRYLKKVIKLNKPYFGICFGGQILARLLGAKVRRDKVMEIGGYDVKLTCDGKKSRFFKDFPAEFPVFHWHGDTFDVPKDAKLLVEGQDCKNQSFSYRNALALQFHLEITSKDAEEWARKYANEMIRVNKTRNQIVDECRVREKTMRKLAYKLLDNFLINTNLVK